MGLCREDVEVGCVGVRNERWGLAINDCNSRHVVCSAVDAGDVASLVGSVQRLGGGMCRECEKVCALAGICEGERSILLIGCQWLPKRRVVVCAGSDDGRAGRLRAPRSVQSESRRLCDPNGGNLRTAETR